MARASVTSMASAGIFQFFAASGMTIVAAEDVVIKAMAINKKDSLFIGYSIDLPRKGTIKIANIQIFAIKIYLCLVNS